MLPPLPPSRLVPEIVHRDDDLLVVVKPAGLAVQPGSGHDYHLLAALSFFVFMGGWLLAALGLTQITSARRPAVRRV